jgi:hypothetical protein
MKTATLCLGALVSLAAGGCTTTATIRTNPPGANLFFGGRYMGKTPVTVELKDGLEAAAGTSARLELEGYRTQNVLLGKEWSPGYIALDILACVPTLGLACYLIYFNGKTHDSEYDFLMLEERRRRPPPAPAPPAPAAEARGVPTS